MANAADYLLLDTTQLLTTYKLRSRSILASTFVAKNIAPNYTLSVITTTNLSGVTVTPAAFVLQPNEVITVTVEYDTNELELLSAGTLEGALNFAVSANPIVIPQVPAAPAQVALPEAPRQIISRIEITPSNFTLSELGETKQYNAILYVDDVIVPNATFTWKLENNLAEAFQISDNGIVKSLKPAINRALVVATCNTPTQYNGTVGLANAATNIPVIVNTNPNTPPQPVTGNLTVTIRGILNSIGGNVVVSDPINQRVTRTTTFNNIPAGVYVVTPTVVSAGNENYNPRGGGQIYVGPGESKEITVDYELQPIPNVDTIGITDIVGPAGVLKEGNSLFVGDRFSVTIQTYRNGLPADIGDVRVNATNTTEGVKTADRGTSPGKSTTTFTVSSPGQITISAIGAGGRSVTGTLTAVSRSTYTIKLIQPTNILVGQCTPITAVVLKDGIETNIPVSIEVTNDIGLISDTPCNIQPSVVVPTPPPTLPPPSFIPEPTATGTSNATGRTVGMDFTQPIVDRATTTSRTLNEAELRTGGNTIRDNVVFVDQGENAI